MTDLIVLGFPDRETAEEARRRSAELVDQGALDLRGAAMAYRHEDGRGGTHPAPAPRHVRRRRPVPSPAG